MTREWNPVPLSTIAEIVTCEGEAGWNSALMHLPYDVGANKLVVPTLVVSIEENP